MCRLALMNNAAVTLLGPYLDYLFGYLEARLGGDGNGVAGLWADDGKTKIRKGVRFTVEQAATCARNYSRLGADWVLFHTRRATSSGIRDQHCHPFKSGQLVMAHNGHDTEFAKLARVIGISDSECMARVWSKMHFPLHELAARSGVFMGFTNGYPFVVKGHHFSDLLAAWNEGTDSLLFASELPTWLIEGLFDQVVSIETIQWFGRDLDPETLDVYPYRPHPSSSSRYHQDWNFYNCVDEFNELPDEVLNQEYLYQEVLYEEEEEEEKDWRLQRQVEYDG